MKENISRALILMLSC